MSEIILNSLLCRAIKICYSNMRDWWRLSLLSRALAALRRAYAASRSQAFMERLGASGNSAAGSVFARALTAIGRGLERFGEWLGASSLYRAISGIKRGYLRLSKNSRLLCLINKLSLHQWLLLAFGLYLPLEYFIRTIVNVPLISSVWEEAFIVLALLLVLWRRALKQTTALRRETVLDAWLLLFFAVGFFLMSAVRPYPAVALDGYRVVVQYMLWYFIILRLLDDDNDFMLLFGTLVGVSIIISLHGMYQYVIGVEIPASWVSQTEMGVRTRVFSLTGSPNIMGSLLVLTAPLTAACIYYCRCPIRKLLAALFTLISLLALLFTFSRGAWVGMVVAVVIFACFVDKRLLTLMAAAIAAVLVAVPSITSRITYLFTQDYAEASAIGGRALRWEAGRLLLSESHPWLGFGLGRFGGAVAMQNQILDETETFSYFYMDNYYLKTMVEMGYLGLIVYLLLLMALLYCGLKAVQRSGVSVAALPGDALTRAEGNQRLLAVGIFSGLAGVLTHCYFENIFEVQYMTAYFWAMAAMLIYLGFFRRK